MAINNFNRVIDIVLYDKNGLSIFRLNTPRVGRKPNITITMNITDSDTISAFNVTIKNLYLDRTREYGSIKVTAGYEGSTKTAFSGQILTMYQEQPGPESVIVIQCTTGRFLNWTNITLNLEFMEGFTLREALSRITVNAHLDAPMISPELQVSSPARFLHHGSVQQAVHRLRDVFPTVNIFCMNNRLFAFPISKSNGQPAKTLPCLTTPPQAIAGEDGISWVHIAAPWDPEVKPGDDVIFNSGYFKSRIGSTAEKTSTMHVNCMEIQFSTVGSVNKMTLKGGVGSLNEKTKIGGVN